MSQLLDLLYPAKCLLCGNSCSDELYLCPGCLADLPINSTACLGCAEPIMHTNSQTRLCGACIKEQHFLDACHAALIYNPISGAMVSRLKFNQHFEYIKPMSRLLYRYLIKRKVEIPDLILPVPLHRLRLKERGFNQSMEIAKPIAKSMERPVAKNICIRLLDTVPQRGLARKARLKNLRHAFELTAPVDGLSIAIIDDVTTTGSTMREIARLLKHAGAGYVQGWSLAKTPVNESDIH